MQADFLHQGLHEEHHLHVAEDTMRVADPDRAEDLLKEYFGAGSSSWTGWDEQFITFIEDNRKAGLLYGTIGDGWHFMLAPGCGKGFWVLSHEMMKGKGLLSPQSIADLMGIARQKGLCHS